MHITEPPVMVGVFSPHGYTDGKGIKRDLNVGSTSPSHRISIYFPDILPCRFNSFTRSLKGLSGGPDSLNRISASISGTSARIRLPRGAAAR